MASRVLLALLLAALAAPLSADEDEETDPFDKATDALKQGDESAITLAAEALKESPLGADENRLVALTWFWAGHFEDSARYMRRALAADPNALMAQPVLADTMPAQDSVTRLNQLAKQIDDDPDLCFLTGVLLLLNKDRPRALAFLVRAAELAGTDGQAEALIRDDDDAEDRNELRGLSALKGGDYADAERSFTFAALDSPTVAEHYAGLALALAASGQLKMARRIANNIYARYHHEHLFEWLHELEVNEAELLAPARELDVKDAPSSDCRLAMLLYMAAEYWSSAREAGVKGLLADQLDTFIHDARIWMDDNEHKGDPKPATDDPDAGAETPASTPPEDATLDTARGHIRDGEYARAREILDQFASEDAEPEVFHLLFVALAGLEEYEQAATAFQAWFLKVDDSDRMRLNAVRELFGKQATFNAWRELITARRDANPNDFTPRLLSCYVEITRGRYSLARDELVVAKFEAPGNAVVQALDRLLQQDEYSQDTTPEGIVDDPSAKALFGRGDRLFREARYEDARSAYLQAQEKDPDLRHVTAALFRCYFALGDYNNAYTQLQRMLSEQDIAANDAGAFHLLLKDGYNDTAAFNEHLDALKEECSERELSWRPWLLYGIILLDEKKYGAALEALQTWHDNVTGERDPVHLKFYELARQRAS